MSSIKKLREEGGRKLSGTRVRGKKGGGLGGRGTKMGTKKKKKFDVNNHNKPVESKTFQKWKYLGGDGIEKEGAEVGGEEGARRMHLGGSKTLGKRGGQIRRLSC